MYITVYINIHPISYIAMYLFKKDLSGPKHLFEVES